MSACEYCWSMRHFFGGDYYASMKDAAERKAPCTQPTLEGAKARAGQFWDEEKQRDRREEPSSNDIQERS
jgi:hypothetical protein